MGVSISYSGPSSSTMLFPDGKAIQAAVQFTVSPFIVLLFDDQHPDSGLCSLNTSHSGEGAERSL